MPATEVIKRRVNALIANTRTQWTESDRHMLEAQDEAFLIRLEQQPLAPLPVEEPTPEPEPETLEAAVARLPQKTREPLLAAMRSYERRKAAIIDIIVANKQNPYDRPTLEKMDEEFLERLCVYGGDSLPGQKPVIAGENYNGRRIPHLRVVQTEETEGPPPPPDTMALVVEQQKKMGIR